jgi:PAS domain S-box-containing protein
MQTSSPNQIFAALAESSDEEDPGYSGDARFPTLEEFAEMDDSEVEACAYHLVASHCSDLITLHRTDGTILSVSKNARRFLGWTPDELVGRNLYELFVSEDLDRLASRIEKSPRSEARCRMRTADDELRWVRLICKARSENDRETSSSAMIAVITDIDDEVRLEESAEKTRLAMLKAERSQSLSELAGAIGHEINNPLTVINGMVRILEAQGDTRDGAVAQLRRSVHRVGLVGRELELLAGTASGELRMVQLDEVVQRLCELAAWDDKSIRCTLEPVCLNANIGLLYQLIYNLIIVQVVAGCGTEQRPVRVECANRQSGVYLSMAGGDVDRAQSLRADLLNAIRGDEISYALPLEISHRLADELGAVLIVENRGGELVTEIQFPHT